MPLLEKHWSFPSLLFKKLNQEDLNGRFLLNATVQLRWQLHKFLKALDATTKTS